MPVAFLEEDEELVQTEREFRTRRASREEQVMYYRRPRGGQFSGWILWSDSQPGKRSDMIIRGFVPIPKYGHLCDEPKHENGDCFNEYGPWGPILCHKDGPREFPIEQILTFRWYTEEGLRASCRGLLPKGKGPGQLFPQLREYVEAGNKIREYPCPDCDLRTYRAVLHLARHLRNSHNWDRQDIMVWAQAQGFDLGREFKAREVVVDMTPSVGPAEPDEPEEMSFVERVEVPTLAEAKDKACHHCQASKTGWCRKHATEALNASPPEPEPAA